MEVTKTIRTAKATAIHQLLLDHRLALHVTTPKLIYLHIGDIQSLDAKGVTHEACFTRG